MSALKLSTQISNKCHPSYLARLEQFIKCRDVIIEGEDAIKAKSTKYLPKLGGQDDKAYNNYKRRALFYSIGSKSLSALVGMASNKKPIITAPAEMINQYFNFDDTNTFDEVFGQALEEVLLNNRVGILTDFDEFGKPYNVIYRAEDILNWHYENNKPTMILLQESYNEMDLNDYTVQIKTRFRRLVLENGAYTQIVYDDNMVSENHRTIPEVRGKALDYIPFVATHGKGLGIIDAPPMMLDIANVNLSHYLSSADLEHGRHFTGLPTPMIFGAQADKPLHIGSDQFIVLPDKQSNAKFLEFTGQGLQSLEKALEQKQSMLASMSARLIDNSSKGSESVDTVRLRYFSETASLATVVSSLNVALNIVYNRIADFLYHSKDSVKIKLDTEFMSSQISAADMTALINGYLNGALTLDIFIYNMRKGQRLDPTMSDEKVKTELEALAKERKEANANKPQVE